MQHISLRRHRTHVVERAIESAWLELSIARSTICLRCFLIERWWIKLYFELHSFKLNFFEINDIHRKLKNPSHWKLAVFTETKIYFEKSHIREKLLTCSPYRPKFIPFGERKYITKMHQLTQYYTFLMVGGLYTRLESFRMLFGFSTHKYYFHKLILH